MKQYFKVVLTTLFVSLSFFFNMASPLCRSIMEWSITNDG